MVYPSWNAVIHGGKEWRAELIWDHCDVCAQAEFLACESGNYYKLDMWLALLAGELGSIHRPQYLVSCDRCSEITHPILSRNTIGSLMWPRAIGTLVYISYKRQHRPLPPVPSIWHGWCQRQDTRLDGPVVCSATVVPIFLCNTAVFVLTTASLSLPCSLVELEKEVNNIKTGLKAVEAVSMSRFPNLHT